MTIIPPPLQLGDTVAVVSPSFGAVGRWPARTERALAYLRGLGLNVELMPNSERSDSWVSATAQERVDDLHMAFAAPEVKLVLCGIGGNHSNQLLPLIDFDLIAANPKWFQGYSDVTVLHWALNKRCDLATLYGPALVPELGDYPKVIDYTDRWLQAAWFGSEPLRYEPATSVTDEFLDWDGEPASLRPRVMDPSEGWVTIAPGRTEGRIIGGCLETICWHLKGQADWIRPEGALFFFETSEEAPSVEHIDAYLTDLEQLGVFDDCTGLIVGRPYGYDRDARDELWRLIGTYADRYRLPALGNVDCSHTDPMLTLPLGVPAGLDADRRTLEVPLRPGDQA